MLLAIGFTFSLGALFVQLLIVFNVTRAEASLVQSVNVACGLGTGFLHGMILQKFGTVVTGIIGSSLTSAGLFISFFATSTPYLVFSIGVVTALGTASLYIVCSAAIGQHFPGNTSVIIFSIINTCAGVGGMIYPFLLAGLWEAFGFRGSFLILAGLMLNTLPGTLLWTSTTKESVKNANRQIMTKNANTDTVRAVGITSDVWTIQNDLLKYKASDSIQETTHVRETAPSQSICSKPEKETGVCFSIALLVKDKTFVFYTVGLALSYTSFVVLLTFIADIYQDAGISVNDANIGILTLNGFSILGRLVPGILMQIRHLTALKVPIISNILAASSMIGLVLVRILPLKLLFSSLAGIAFGILQSCFNVTTIVLVGSRQLGNALGLAFTVTGLANVAAGPISGLIRDKTGSYLAVFISSAGVQLIAAVFFYIADILHKRKCSSKRLAVLKQST